ncbi:stress response protein NST1-like [Zerene cesonia]|uniref:stress response protein NST1-like n=1 Tax=Zerene cesonia TaxID=33412 RepID=UPI0018E4F84E|nr:stress response protein NST1-like [Zerene cesonia]
MGVNSTEFEIFEKQFTELVGEFQVLTISESRLRDALRNEAARAEAAKAARDVVEKSAADMRANAAAATAGATHAAQALNAIQDNLNNVKVQLDVSERTRMLFEEKCTEMSENIAVLEKELQQLRPLQSSYVALQRQYIELQEQTHTATEEARREVSRLENELRRVERCAGAGSELRERARLAAAAHARERRLAAAELLDTNRELHAANAEIMRLKIIVSELQCKLSAVQEKRNKEFDTHVDQNILEESKAALDVERSTSARLEKALQAAIADNATLSAELHRIDNNSVELQYESSKTEDLLPTHICPIDSFLAD